MVIRQAQDGSAGNGQGFSQLMLCRKDYVESCAHERDANAACRRTITGLRHASRTSPIGPFAQDPNPT